MVATLLLLIATHRHSIVGTWDWSEGDAHSTVVFQAVGAYCRYVNLKPGYLVNRGLYTMKHDLLTMRGTSLTSNGRTVSKGGPGTPESYHVKWDSNFKFHWDRPGGGSRVVIKRLSGRQQFPATG